MQPPQIVGDRLYSIAFRPQELAVYGERVSFAMRYSPVFDDEAETATRHFKLLVLEIHAELPADDDLRRAAGQRMQLLKCGWELELSTAEPVPVGTLPEDQAEFPLLIARIADTANDLARRARLEAPLGPSVVAGLIADFRARS